MRDQIVAETRGNPLALLELPHGLTAAQLAGGFGFPGVVALSGKIEENFLRRVDALPEQTRRLLLIAAADPSGDAALVWRAAAQLGIGTEAATPATEAAPGRIRRPGCVPALPGPLGDLSVGVRRRSDGGYTEPWPKPPTRRARSRPARLAPRAGRCRARRGVSPQSSSVRPAAPGHAEAWRRQRRSCTVPPA